MKENMKQTLTTETLRGLFTNNFELTNYAIRLARFYIKTGNEVGLTKLLAEVKRNPNTQYLKDLEALENNDEA
ncbi:MAG: hypothetical protein RLZZ453_882 [Chlamydiota bacterium]|jgi:hypothetical protein